MTKWLIQQADGGGVPSYYSQKVARALGSMHGWSPAVKDALQFDSERAAEMYADRHLQMTQVNIVKSPFK